MSLNERVSESVQAAGCWVLLMERNSRTRAWFLLGIQNSHVSMPLTTILMLIPLCVATALRTVYHGFMRALLGPTRVSALARRHLALVMMAPYLLGLGLVGIRPNAADAAIVILIVASSQTVGLVVAFLALSFCNLERRSNIL